MRIDSAHGTSASASTSASWPGPSRTSPSACTTARGVTHDYEGDAEFSLLPTGSPALDAAVAEVIPAGTVPVRELRSASRP